MGVFNENAIIGASSAAAAGGGYDIPYSCRFDRASSSKLVSNSTHTSSTSWTFSGWFKRSVQSGVQEYFVESSGVLNLIWDNDDELYIGTSAASNGAKWVGLTGSNGSSGKYRDFSAWYHLVVRSTPSKWYLYINGELIEEVTATAAAKSSVQFSLGISNSGSLPYDGYMAEVHYLDGIAVDADSFGESGDYGEWKPIKYTGSHGTNGFYLDFKSNGSLGNDASANSNHFTPTNIAASDQMLDSPTNNFCGWNPLDNKYPQSTLSEGNLKLQTGTSSIEPCHTANFGMSSGKWYFEIQQTADASGGNPGGLYGIAGQMGEAANHPVGYHSDQYSFYSHPAGGNVVSNGGYQSYGTIVGWTSGDILSIAVDLDNNKIYGAKNNVWFNSGNPAGNSNGYTILAASATTLGLYLPAIGDYGAYSITSIANFGQDGTFAGTKTAQNNADDAGYGNFYYDVPAGFKALCSKNLEDCAVIPSEHFNAVVYTGTGSSNPRTDVGFQPDFTWIKCRTLAHNNELTDSVRGATKRLRSGNTSVETTVATGLTAFTSTGFTVGGLAEYNQSGHTYVAWNWKAGTAGSGSTSGSGTAKTYTASYNVDAGFSIVAYTGNGTAGHTIPHHLGVAPDLIMVKQRNATSSWCVYADITHMGAEKFMELHANSTIQVTDVWNDVEPTSSVFSLGAGSDTNINDATYIAYCWRSIEGYSKVGAYLGNNNNDNAFIYTGFRPAYVLIKTKNGSYGWVLNDSTRHPINPKGTTAQGALFADHSGAETGPGNGLGMDFLSNGFKIRDPGAWGGAGSNTTKYLYYAVAEVPFKQANAV